VALFEKIGRSFRSLKVLAFQSRTRFSRQQRENQG